MSRNLGMTITGAEAPEKENAETLLTIRKRCGTVIESADCPYRPYHDTAKTRDPYYYTKKKDTDHE